MVTTHKFFKRFWIEPAFIDADLTDYPVVIDTRVDLDLKRRLSSGGLELDFGTKPHIGGLPYEVEFDLPGNFFGRRMVIWLKLPKVFANRRTYFYMLYGDQSAVGNRSLSQLWQAAHPFDAVYHMDESLRAPIVRMLDSSSNGNDGALNSGSCVAEGDLDAGIASEALMFQDQSWDLFSVSDFMQPDPNYTDAFTISYWATHLNQGTIIGALDANASNFLTGITPSGGQFFAAVQVGGGALKLANTPIPAAVPTLLTFVKDDANNEERIYVNGQLDGTFANTVIAATAEPTFSGNPCGSQGWSGTVDELRFVDQVLSDAWIKADYEIQKTFMWDLGPQNIGIPGTVIKDDKEYLIHPRDRLPGTQLMRGVSREHHGHR